MNLVADGRPLPRSRSRSASPWRDALPPSRMEPLCHSPPSSPLPPRSRPAPARRSRSTRRPAVDGGSGCRGRPRRARRSAHGPGHRPLDRLARATPRHRARASTPADAAESYRITADAASVVVTGADAAGLFYGVQTLGQLIARDGDGWSRARGRDRRCAPLRLPRRDARRRASLPPGRDGQGLHRPRGEPEVQRAAPAPHRRPGLAHPARLAAEAHRARVGHVRRRRPRRLLHEGRLSRDRRVRGIPPHDRRARDRHARPHARGRARVSGARRGAGDERSHRRAVPRPAAACRRRARRTRAWRSGSRR